jgi:hypothetical protein
VEPVDVRRSVNVSLLTFATSAKITGAASPHISIRSHFGLRCGFDETNTATFSGFRSLLEGFAALINPWHAWVRNSGYENLGP